MTFLTDTQQLENQIQVAANHANKKDGLTPVVTICKLKPRSRKTFYAFHFEPIGSVNVGDVQHLEDGSVRRIEYIF